MNSHPSFHTPDEGVQFGGPSPVPDDQLGDSAPASPPAAAVAATPAASAGVRVGRAPALGSVPGQGDRSGRSFGVTSA